MTRPYKLLEAEKVEDVVAKNKKNLPEDSLRYKIYKFVGKKPVTLNHIREKIKPDGSRRHMERTLTEMMMAGHIKRKRCPCGQGYLYFQK